VVAHSIVSLNEHDPILIKLHASISNCRNSGYRPLLCVTFMRKVAEHKRNALLGHVATFLGIEIGSAYPLSYDATHSEREFDVDLEVLQLLYAVASVASVKVSYGGNEMYRLLLVLGFYMFYLFSGVVAIVLAYCLIKRRPFRT